MIHRLADRSSMQNRHTGTVIVMVCGACLLLGCASPTSPYSQRTAASAPPATASLAYERAFRSKNYAEAARLASQAPSRDETARLIEGMARAELNEDTRATSLLRPLLRASDPAIRGRAAATLGLIEHRRGNHAEAAELLDIAAGALDGADGVWAERYATTARGGSPGTSRTGGSLASAANAAGGYEIQFGSFSTQARAQRHAQAVSRMTQSTGLSSPRIETVQLGARTLYAVRAGSFGSRSAALEVASRLETDTAVVRTN